MRDGIPYLTVAILFLASVGAFAANTIDPLSGLPIAPGFTKLADPMESYTFCGKSARSISYIGGESADPDHENSWYAHAMLGAFVFTAIGGVKTFITPDGTAAVETARSVISFLRFSPGLSPAEMKILGAAPAAKACTAD
jgi:hypothetical protein